MTQKFVEGDEVICVISDRDSILEEGKCYIVSFFTWDLVRVSTLDNYFDALRFRLATPLNKALS